MLLSTGQDEGQSCYAIATASARYYYQDTAGGFSSICDRDGVDWIGFHPGEGDVPGGAANVFRGIPNMVYPDGLGHPGFSGCRSQHSIEDDTVRIQTESTDGKWRWHVLVTEEFVRLSVDRAPDDRTYWFLYEGLVGGVYDPEGSYWGSPAGRRTPADVPPEVLATSTPEPGEQWYYFGHTDAPRVFYCARLHNPGEQHVLYFMGSDGDRLEARDGMIVFGFGRGPGVESQLTGANDFVFGFVESTDHEEIAQEIGQAIEAARDA